LNDRQELEGVSDFSRTDEATAWLIEVANQPLDSSLRNPLIYEHMFDTDGFLEETRALDDDALDAEIASLASNMAAATYRWLILIAELDDRESWYEWGALSCEEWLSYRCGISPATAKDQLRVAHRLKEMPLVGAHLARGKLSYSQVRALARVVTPENEEDMVEVALHSTAAQLERIVRVYRKATPWNDLEAVNERHSFRRVDYFYDDEGNFVIRGKMSPEEGALVALALDRAADSVWKETGETGEQKRADALVEMAETYLSAETHERTGGDATQIVLHVDADTLVDGSGDRCELESGVGIHPETTRRLGCDASVVTVLERDGEILSVGRKTRKLSSAIKRALKSRDGCCRFPGCRNGAYVDGHHIQHWTKDGETKLSNLILYCRGHHRLFHEGGFTMTMNKDGTGLRIWDARGREVPQVVPPEPAACRLEKMPSLVRAGIDADACRSQWDGGRVDAVYIADVLSGHELARRRERISGEEAALTN
jgi:hypothetical protein